MPQKSTIELANMKEYPAEGMNDEEREQFFEKNRKEIKKLRREMVILTKEGEKYSDKVDMGETLSREELDRWDDILFRVDQISDRLKLFDKPATRPLEPPWDDGPVNRRKGGPAEDRSYAGMFLKPGQVPEKCGFADFEEFLQTVHVGRNDPRLVEYENRTQSLTPGSSGGFLVPPNFAAKMLNDSLEMEICRPRCQVWPIEVGNGITIPGFDGGDHSDDLYGGFQGEWLAENATGTKRTAKVRSIKLDAKKLACYTNASNELVADGMNFEALLGSALTKTLGWYLDYAILNGTGAGQPLGILNSGCLVTVSKETGQQPSTIIYENLVKMFARMLPQSVNNAVWICNNTAIPQLLTLSIAVGTGGSHIPVLSKNDAGGYDILTRPVIFTEKLPALGTVGDIIFSDFSFYALGLRKEVRLEKSNAPGWTEDQSDYRSIIRVDGQSTLNEAVTPKNGDTLSPFIALASRT